MFNYRNYGRLWRVYGRSILCAGSLKKIQNALRTEYAYRRRHSDVRTPPYILNVEPLYYCNLDCPLCDRQIFPDARKKDAGRLALEVVDKIFDEIGAYLFQCQIFGQGEPLLDWNRTRQIIEKAHRRRIFTLLSTNCTLVTPQIAEEIVSCGLDYLVCAIDGVSQEAYATYRVGGLAEKAFQGLRIICAERDRQHSKIAVEWQYLVHKHNIHEMEQARRIAKEYGVFLRFSPLSVNVEDPAVTAYWKPDSPLWKETPPPSQGPVYDWPCYFLWRALVVNSNARLARCLVYQNVAQYGDLRSGSVMSFYNGPESQRARQLFQKGRVPEGDFPSPCKNCSFYKRHHGGPLLGKCEAVRAEYKGRDLACIPLKVVDPPRASARE